MTGMTRGFGLYTLAGALLVGGIALLAAPQAQAQAGPLFDDYFDLDPASFEGLGCVIFEGIVNDSARMCDGYGGHTGIDCTVETDDCTKLCATESRVCWKSNKALLKMTKKNVGMAVKVAKRLCKLTIEPTACKEALKSAKQNFKVDLKIVMANVKSECIDPALITSCEAVCNSPSGNRDSFASCAP